MGLTGSSSGDSDQMVASASSCQSDGSERVRRAHTLIPSTSSQHTLHTRALLLLTRFRSDQKMRGRIVWALRLSKDLSIAVGLLRYLSRSCIKIQAYK